MFAIIQNNIIALLVPAGTAFEWDSIQYPANWCNLSSPEEKAAIGMVDVVYGSQPSDVYYWISQDAPVYADGVVTINYTATPKDLEGLKKQAVANIKAAAASLLAQSDWMVTRAFETSTTVDPKWSAYRAGVRDASNKAEAVVMAATSIDELIAAIVVDFGNDPNYVEPVPIKATSSKER